MLVNAVAPFLLNARLKPLMLRTPERDKHIVNVSAMEGQFYRRFKTTRHPHTNMAKAALKTGMFAQMKQAHIDFMLSKIPMGRFGAVEEIAALVAWLSTEECSFSTGAVFDLSGGRAVY